MDNHKRVLGIIYIITSILQIIILSLLALLWSAISGFIIAEIGPDDARIVEFIFSILRVIPWIIIVFISFPSLITGMGLLNGKKWALIMALVLGCLKIISFPIGTAIGIYSIWVYLESNKV